MPDLEFVSPYEVPREHCRPLPGFIEDPATLLQWLGPRVGSADLETIAQADYGIGGPQNLRILGHIVTTGLVPRPMPMELAEVLYLTLLGDDGHETMALRSALAATLLSIESVTNSAAVCEAINCTPLVSRLVWASERLGRGAMVRLLPLLAWLVACDVDDDLCDQGGTHGIELLLVAGWIDPHDPRIVDTLAFIDHSWDGGEGAPTLDEFWSIEARRRFLDAVIGRVRSTGPSQLVGRWPSLFETR